ncbi:HsdM family class I SAM-dependent methyltransferase [Natrinema saccharevitans]|nr:N-6 DNA methylase [Natrinema saccharevitans]
MASYLRDNGVEAVTQVSISTPGTRSQPDFQVSTNGRFLGEAKWESNKWEGFAEARDYGQITGVDGTFLICYPDQLKDEGGQARLTNTAESVLSGHKYSVAFLRRDAPTDTAKLDLEEIPRWLNSHIRDERTPEPDPDEVVSVLRQTAYRLNEELETAPDENLFRNVLGASPEDEEEREAARQTAGFLLVNQITFYRVLSSSQQFPEIDPDKLSTPSDLAEYFDLVLEVDYTPVFSFRIANDLPQTAFNTLRDSIKSIYALRPETITHDVLGKVFHELIPHKARKKVAAYYTMNKPAQILADLSIHNSDAKVMDPACGSGSLLAASYLRKRSLTESGFSEQQHQEFVENDIAGIDVMPFAAHLSCIHLALQAPIYETDEVNIGIEDSTKLRPGSTISPLSFVLPQKNEQRGLAEFSDGQRPNVSEETIESGSVAMDAVAGKEMTLTTVDTVIMNPPFTRQESVAGFADGYKDRLRDRFSRRDNKGHIHGKMSYCSYFLFLADKFLEPGGRIAAVLPASVLNKSSDSGIRQMLLNEYSIEFLFAREDASNFSEDTDLREVMIIARKGEPEDGESVACVSFDGLDVDSDDIRTVADSLRNAEPGEAQTVSGQNGSEATVWRVPLEELDEHNLFSTFSVKERDLIKRWYEIVDNDEKLCQVKDLDPGLTRGGSSHPWTSGILADPQTHTRKNDVWVVKDDDDPLVVAHKHINEEIEIPRSSVEPYFLRKPYRAKVDVTDIEEYTVVRPFNGIDRFLSLAEEENIPGNWEEHVTENAAHMAIPETIKLTAPGTRHPVYYSEKSRVWHRMWMHTNITGEDARRMALWFDSTIGLLQLFVSRIPVEGAWTKYRRYSQSGFYGFDINRLSQADQDQLDEAWEAWKNVECPSIIKQMILLADPSKLSIEDERRVEQHYEARDEIGEGFQERRELDKEILDIVGYDEEQQDELLEELYTGLLLELIELTEMGE